MLGLFRRARAFVFGSMYEGFGLPVLEALAEGCPTVVPINSSLVEVAGSAVCYATSESPSDLQFALDLVLRDDAYAHDLSERASSGSGTFLGPQCDQVGCSLPTSETTTRCRLIRTSSSTCGFHWGETTTPTAASTTPPTRECWGCRRRPVRLACARHRDQRRVLGLLGGEERSRRGHRHRRVGFRAVRLGSGRGGRRGRTPTSLVTISASSGKIRGSGSKRSVSTWDCTHSIFR